MSWGRIAIGAAGVSLGIFGIFRLATEIPLADLKFLLVWLVVALALHDGVLAPLTTLVGAVLTRVLPQRVRRYVVGALVTGVGITVITVPLLLREDSQPAVKTLLRQNYLAHLAWLWLAIGVSAGTLYGARVVRDRRG